MFDKNLWTKSIAACDNVEKLKDLCTLLVDKLEYNEVTIENLETELNDDTPARIVDADGFMEPSARRDDLDTSKAAAKVAKFNCSKDRAKVLHALYVHNDLTDYELERETGVRQNSISKRRLECKRAGYVKQFRVQGIVQRRKTAGAKTPCVVWTLTNAGRAYTIANNLTHGANINDEL